MTMQINEMWIVNMWGETDRCFYTEMEALAYAESRIKEKPACIRKIYCFDDRMLHKNLRMKLELKVHII